MAAYLDQDDEIAQLLAPTFNPADKPEEVAQAGSSSSPIGAVDTAKTGTSQGVRGQIQSPAPNMQGVSRPPNGGAVTSTAPVPQSPTAPATPPAPSVPAATAPSGNATGTQPSSWKDTVRNSLQRQSTSMQAAEQGTAALQNQPSLQDTQAPLEAQRAQLAQPIDQNQPQYKPSIATRIFRGIDGVRRGGILGAFDPADTGAKAYGAPNRAYDVAAAQQQQKLGAVDQQLSQSANSFKELTDRAKATAQMNRANATGENDVSKNANAAGKNDQQYQEAIAKLGQKEVDDPDNAGQKKLVDDPQSAAFKNRQDLDNYRQGMEKVAELKGQVEKDKVTPGTPAWNQRQQEINAASQRANAYMGNYLQRSKNVDLGGGTLPGAPQIGNDAGGRTTVGTGNASTAIKNQANVAQFNDVHGALDSLEGSAKALVKSGGSLNSPRVAAALAQPHGTLNQWLQGEGAKSGLTPQERDYVIANASAHENIQAMRKAAGGTATDASVAKLDALIPNASTPDLNYFLKQTGQIRSTAQRLGTGVTQAAGGSTLRNGTPAAPAAKTAPTPDTHVFDSSAYHAKHPEADIEKVKAYAKSKGFTVK